MTARLPDGSTMEYSHIATLVLSGLSKQASQVHIFPKMKTATLISLGLFCGDGCTVTLDKQDISVHKNVQEIIKVTRNKKTGMWEVPLENQQPAAVINKILTQTSKPELAQYLQEALFIPTAASLFKAIKKGFLKTWPGLTKKLIKTHMEKSRNTLIVHLNMRRQSLQPTKEKPPDIDLEEKSKQIFIVFHNCRPYHN